MKTLYLIASGEVIALCPGPVPALKQGEALHTLTEADKALLAANKGAKFRVVDGVLAVLEPAKLPVPTEVGSGQIRAALIAKGVAVDDDALTATIEAAITAAVSDPAQRAIAITLWRNASTFKRAHAFVSVVKGALSKDDAWVDDLFRLAATF